VLFFCKIHKCRHTQKRFRYAGYFKGDVMKLENIKPLIFTFVLIIGALVGVFVPSIIFPREIVIDLPPTKPPYEYTNDSMIILTYEDISLLYEYSYSGLHLVQERTADNTIIYPPFEDKDAAQAFMNDRFGYLVGGVK
jgi:hypothetical protein